MREMRVLAAVAAVGLAAAACSGADERLTLRARGEQPSNSSTSSTTAQAREPLTTTTSTSTSSTSTTTTEPESSCPNYVPGRPPHDLPPPDARGAHGTQEEQDRAWGDLQRAQEYGKQHPGEYGGVMLWNEPRVRVVVAFTDHLADHCEALRQRLQYPEEFELYEVPWTEEELHRVQDEVSALAGERLREAGRYLLGPLRVKLRADGEGLAAQLQDRYRDALDLQVGLFPYPKTRITDEWSAFCTPPSGTRTAGVEVTIELDDASVASGAEAGGTLVVRNTGLEAFSFVPQPRSAVVVTTGTRDIVAVHDVFAHPAIGYVPRRLGPGESATVPLAFGTASCDASVGYALPPGTYGLLDAVAVTWESTGETDLVLSRAATLTVREA